MVELQQETSTSLSVSHAGITVTFTVTVISVLCHNPAAAMRALALLVYGAGSLGTSGLARPKCKLGPGHV